ncbi:glutathione transferase [Aureococcus anophagefferens]|uniref:Glutathione transferase n=1 Tax=Aureococcus anophagefferens TaxID=44056 RepID=A0ABR1FV60_AURAN
MTWAKVEALVAPVAAAKAPRPGDVRIVFYRDANAWCPHCHKVWFALEQKGLRYETVRVHLRGDPREPPKPAAYVDLVPSGAVPAVALDGEVVTESLVILERLEAIGAPLGPGSLFRAQKDALLRASDDYDCDGDRWLRNGDPAKEAALKADAVAKLETLDAWLAGGPFFLKLRRPSLVDAAYVGFLTRLAHNYAYFKGYDVKEAHANVGAWFAAMEGERGYRATRQEACFEQRVYQFHPSRRRHAEACMGLRRRLVGEPDGAVQPAPEVARLGAPAPADARRRRPRSARGARPGKVAYAARASARRPGADDALLALCALLGGAWPDDRGDRGAAAAAAAAGGAARARRRLRRWRRFAAAIARRATCPRRRRPRARRDPGHARRVRRRGTDVRACGEPRAGEPPACEWADPCASCVDDIARATDATIEL